MATGTPATSRGLLSLHTQLLMLLLMILLVALYTRVRIDGWIAGTDTANNMIFINTVVDSGRLDPTGTGHAVYNSGHAYSSFVTFVTLVTGLSVVHIQVFLSALLAPVIIIPIWLTYREFLKDTSTATLATAILLVQPELLFVMMRGTHELFTRALMLICLFLLVHSLRTAQSAGQLAPLVVGVYLAAFGVMAYNNLIGTSFILAIGLSLGLAWFIMRPNLFTLRPIAASKSVLLRLGFATVICLILAFLYMMYLYSPALSTVAALDRFGDRAAVLALDVEQTEELQNPYQQINFAWTNPWIYVVVVLPNLALLGVSALIWLGMTFRWLLFKQRPKEVHILLLWLFYGAFGFIGVLSIVADLVGGIANNLQHRSFPAFGLLAAPLIAYQISAWRSHRPILKHALTAVLLVVLPCFAILAILKATNEPLISNNWKFVTPAELAAAEWANTALSEQPLWTGFDTRIFNGYRIHTNDTSPAIIFDREDVDSTTRDFLISDVIQLRSLRLGVPLPIQPDSFVVYDNGQANVYHQRPVTPYER
jgi:hypothetical protein